MKRGTEIWQGIRKALVVSEATSKKIGARHYPWPLPLVLSIKQLRNLRNETFHTDRNPLAPVDHYWGEGDGTTRNSFPLLRRQPTIKCLDYGASSTTNETTEYLVGAHEAE